MKSVQTPTSDSYNDYLRSSLQDRENAAAFLTAILEEENPEPELLIKALGKVHLTSEEMKQYQQYLQDIFSSQGSEVIYHLADWLNRLGLELIITVKD